jgi:hypothetical protein
MKARFLYPLAFFCLSLPAAAAVKIEHLTLSSSDSLSVNLSSGGGFVAVIKR